MRYAKYIYVARLNLFQKFALFTALLFVKNVCGYTSRRLDIQKGYGYVNSESVESSSIYDDPNIMESTSNYKMSSLDEYLKYVVNDMLFPIDGIIKGYCLYRSVLDEMKNDFESVSKEEITVLALILSGSWKNPISFISNCKNGFKKLRNISRITSKSSIDSNWSSISGKRGSIKSLRINVCFKARVCSRHLKKKDGAQQIREFLNSRTQYSFIYPNNGSEETVWNVIREYKHIISAGVIKGEVNNYLRVIVLFNYLNKAIKHIQGTPLDFSTCIALINTMVRERSLNEWLASSTGKGMRNRGAGFDKVTRLKYDSTVSTSQNIANFKVKTCIHVIWSSEVLFDEYSNNAESKYAVLSALGGRVSWICKKMFSDHI